MHNNDTFCNCRYMAGDQTLIQEINANAEKTERLIFREKETKLSMTLNEKKQ